MLFVAVDETHDNPLLPAWPDIIWSAVVLVIILLFFGFYVLPKLNKLLDKRSKLIEGRIAEAAQTKAKANELLEKYTEQLAEARQAASLIREEAKSDRKRILEEAKLDADDQVDRTLARMRAQLEADRQAALTSLRRDVGDLALSLAGRVIEEELSESEKSKRMVDNFIQGLDASSAR